jgi:hypothetical protein
MDHVRQGACRTGLVAGNGGVEIGAFAPDALDFAAVAAGDRVAT